MNNKRYLMIEYVLMEMSSVTGKDKESALCALGFDLQSESYVMTDGFIAMSLWEEGFPVGDTRSGVYCAMNDHPKDTLEQLNDETLAILLSEIAINQPLSELTTDDGADCYRILNAHGMTTGLVNRLLNRQVRLVGFHSFEQGNEP